MPDHMHAKNSGASDEGKERIQIGNKHGCARRPLDPEGAPCTAPNDALLLRSYAMFFSTTAIVSWSSVVGLNSTTCEPA
jgi:hypothetical protein